MSSDKNLQEMEAGTKQSRTAVNAGAKAADPMPTMADPGTQLAGVEDLGGPTPENYKPDNDSAKLKEPKIATVKDVVNKGAKAADPMKKMAKEEAEVEEEVLEEEEIVSESEEVTEESVDIDEDVNALLGGEDLSEDFKEKAKTIFEAAINAKVASIKEEIEAQYAEKLSEEIEEAKVALGERVDSYLEYVADEWFTENALVIEHALKTEMTESFLEGMKGLFEEHYVTIPEDKYDVLESMVDKLDDMETKLNEQIDKNISLNKRLSEATADGIFESVSDGLAATQKEKLASLAESVEFESEAEYREKLETLKESYFSRNTAAAPKTETLSEGVDESPEFHSNSMDRYLRTLGSFSTTSNS